MVYKFYSDKYIQKYSIFFLFPFLLCKNISPILSFFFFEYLLTINCIGTNKIKDFSAVDLIEL